MIKKHVLDQSEYADTLSESVKSKVPLTALKVRRPKDDSQVFLLFTYDFKLRYLIEHAHINVLLFCVGSKILTEPMRKLGQSASALALTKNLNDKADRINAFKARLQAAKRQVFNCVSFVCNTDTSSVCIHFSSNLDVMYSI